MLEAIETTEYKNHTIEIFQDENPENPIKEWDMLGEFICWHSRYDLGNSKRFDTPEEVREYAKKTNSLLYPLFMYDHSGIALSLSNSQYPFNCRWDAGQLGYVLIDREKALKEYSKKILTKKLKQKIYEVIQGEVNTYNQYLSGDVYGYKVIDKDGTEIDSCWGYYGMEDVIEEAKSMVDYEIKKSIKEHIQKLKKWIKNHVPYNYRTSLSI